MGTSLRRLAALVAAVATAVIFAITPAHLAGAASADPVCPFSTNWDNVLHICD